jgi:hypothetical protein
VPGCEYIGFDVSDCAFAEGTYDETTFDVCVQRGSHRRNRTQEWYKAFEVQVGKDIERQEMKLSEELARKLKEQIEFNQAMLQVNNNLLLANNNLLGVVHEIQDKAQVVPTRPQMDPEKKALLLARLHEGKERKRLEAEKMRQRMSKVRKGKGK